MVVCEICNKEFSSKRQLKRHFDRQHRVSDESNELHQPDPICETTNDELDEHAVKVVRKKREGEVIGEICKTEFSSKRHLRRHFGRIHSDDPTSKPSTRPKSDSFTSPDFSSDAQCNRERRSKAYLEDDFGTGNEAPAIGSSRLRDKRLQKTSRPEDNSSGRVNKRHSVTLIDAASTSKRHDAGRERLVVKISVKNDEITSDCDDNDDDCDAASLIHCEHCKAYFETIRDLELHKESHRPPDTAQLGVKCELCSRRFSTHADIRTHLNTDHERPTVLNRSSDDFILS